MGSRQDREGFEPVTVYEDESGRFLVAHSRWKCDKPFRVRIATEGDLRGMSAGSLRLYRKKVQQLQLRRDRMHDADAIRTLDYLRHALSRQGVRPNQDG